MIFVSILEMIFTILKNMSCIEKIFMKIFTANSYFHAVKLLFVIVSFFAYFVQVSFG